MNCLGILFRYRFCFITSGLGPGVLLSEYQGFPGLAWQNDGPPLRVADAGPRVHRALRVESQWILVLCGFYKVAEYWISKYWTIDAEGNTELGLCEPWSQHFCHLINTQSCFICASFFFFVFPGGSVVKNLPANAGATGNVGLIPGSERSPGEGHGNTLQYSCLGNATDRGAWWATVHGVAKSRLWLKCLSTNVFFTGTSLNRYYWFISIKFLSHTMTHLWMKLIQHLCFLCELCHNLLAVRDTSHRQCYAWRPL